MVPGLEDSLAEKTVWTESTTKTRGRTFSAWAMIRSMLRLGQEIELAVPDAQPVAADLDLLEGFLARDVEDPLALGGEIPADLEEEGRLADARLAADQDERAEDDAPAEDLVEFLDWILILWLVDLLDVLVEQRFGRRERIFGRRGCLLGLLDQRVPFAAARTAAQPFGRTGAAGLADEDRLQLVLHRVPRPRPKKISRLEAEAEIIDPSTR